jgi:hypothetical protein
MFLSIAGIKDMPSRAKKVIGTHAVVWFLCTLPAFGQLVSTEFSDFLQRHIGFSRSDLRKVEQGKVVTKALDTEVKSEVAIFGVILVRVPIDLFVQKFRDIEQFKKSEKVLQIGRFSNPPTRSDLNELSLELGDLRDISKCRVGKCEIKLSAEVIVRLQKEVDWSVSGHYFQVTSLAQEMLIEYVTSYLQGGNAALTVYHDQKIPVSLEEQFRELLQESPYLFEYVPEFHEYLEKFPEAELSGVEDFIYWSKEDLGLKPVITLTHVSIYQRDSQSRPPILISSKQIYANHYFEGSLGLTALVPVRPVQVDDPASGFFLLYLNRSRANQLDGTFSGIRHHIVEGRAKSAMKENMKRIKAQLEVDSRAASKTERTE